MQRNELLFAPHRGIAHDTVEILVLGACEVHIGPAFGAQPDTFVMELRLQADETIMTRALVARRLFPSFCITCSVERKKAATVTSHVLFVGLREANIAHITCSYSVTHRVGHPLRMYILARALSIILFLGGSFPSQAGGGLETFFRSRQWWKSFMV